MTSRKTPAADTPQSAHSVNNTSGGAGNGGRTVSARDVGILLTGLACEIANALELIEADIGEAEVTERLGGAAALLRACGAQADRFAMALNVCPYNSQDRWLIARLDLLQRIEGGKQ